jgi:6-phosphogluconolactonase
VVRDGDALAATFVARLAAAVEGKDGFAIALTGGGSAKTLYPKVAEAKLALGACRFFFGDERAVPKDHADSNYALARKVLLAPLEIADARVFRMEGENEDVEAAARDYEVRLREALGGAVELDLVHLGMGPDGHVCSLFPDHELLDETEALVSSLRDAPKPPKRRITLTMPALYRAREVWITVTGAEKADAVCKAIEDEFSTLPVAQVARRVARVVWFLDSDAAGKLARNSDGTVTRP